MESEPIILKVQELYCTVCGKPATIMVDGRPHCPMHEYRFGRKEELPLEREVPMLQRGVRKKSQRCNVPDCEGYARWRCDVSGFNYCETHKQPHGTQELKHSFTKLRMVEQ